MAGETAGARFRTLPKGLRNYRRSEAVMIWCAVNAIAQADLIGVGYGLGNREWNTRVASRAGNAVTVDCERIIVPVLLNIKV